MNIRFPSRLSNDELIVEITKIAGSERLHRDPDCPPGGVRIARAAPGHRLLVAVRLLPGGPPLRLLAPHLQPANSEKLLAAVSGKSKREVQELLAALAPRPDTPDSIRKLPEPAAPPRESLTLSAALQRDLVPPVPPCRSQRSGDGGQHPAPL